MDKWTLLRELESSMQKGEILKEEVAALIGSSSQTEGVQTVTSEGQKKNFSIDVTNILYGIGGLVIFAGVIALVFQNWDSFNGIARIGITLGMALVLYVSSVLLRYQAYDVLSQVMSAVSYALLPLGIGVTLYELDIEPSSLQISIIATILTLFTTTSYFFVKKGVVHLLFALIFGTVTLYSYMATIDETFSSNLGDAYLYLTAVIGIAYGLFAYTLKESPLDHGHARLSKLLFSLGALGVLIPAISLGGIWDILFVFVVVGTFLGSVYLHSRGMLVLSSLFLIFYLFKITAQYFAGSIGWPVALIFIGIITIAVAVVTFKLNQKYFGQTQQVHNNERL